MNSKNYIPTKRHSYSKLMLLVTLVVLIFMLNSCKTEVDNPNNLPGINFGTSTYSDSFLFSESTNSTVEKKIKINFNNWAQKNKGFADLYFVDDGDKIIGTPGSNVKLFINDKHIIDGIIQLSSVIRGNDSLTIELKLDPSDKSKNFNGYLILRDGNIERINNIETLNSSGIELFKWNAKQDVVMNPLKKGLLWFLGVLSTSLLIWVLLMRNRIYPKMARGQIILNSPYYKSTKTKGARQIIFSNKHYKQGWFNKLFAGEIIYEKNDFWQEEIKFSPARRRQIRIKMPAHYNIQPFTSKIDQGKTYTIKGNQKEVKFSFL